MLEKRVLKYIFVITQKLPSSKSCFYEGLQLQATDALGLKLKQTDCQVLMVNIFSNVTIQKIFPFFLHVSEQS